MKIIEINDEPIALYQLLKFEALVSSGGEAKGVIDDGKVIVNGVVETRRRKKIMTGDIVHFGNESFTVKLI